MVLTICWACIDPLDIEIKDEGSNLVVFAEVTDQAEEYIVNLTRTSSYESGNPPKETGAKVTVLDSEGREFVFMEEEEGVYKSCPAEFIGEIGQSYKLRIETQEDQIYESDLEEILPTGEIDSVYFKRESKPTFTNGSIRPVNGLSLFCSFRDNPAKEYLKVDWSGTFQFRSSNFDPLYDFCWKTESSTFDINLYDDAFTNNSLKEDFEITFLEEGFRFGIDYSFQAQLKSLTPGAYNFWRLIEQQYENNGSIFSALPAQINSNIKCITNPEEKVLGYFITSAQAAKRIRISPYDLGGQPSTSELPGCRPFRPGDPIADYCYDCSLYTNSSGTEPSYW